MAFSIDMTAADLGLQFRQILLLLQLRADSAGSQADPETEVALQQRQCLDPETRLTIPVVQDSRCLGRRSGCAWIQASGRDASLYAVSVNGTTVPDIFSVYVYSCLSAQHHMPSICQVLTLLTTFKNISGVNVSG